MNTKSLYFVVKDDINISEEEISISLQDKCLYITENKNKALDFMNSFIENKKDKIKKYNWIKKMIHKIELPVVYKIVEIQTSTTNINKLEVCKEKSEDQEFEDFWFPLSFY
jgi:uncharacterized protein (DUF2344 family)